MEKMKNVIFIDKDKSERTRALDKLKQLGYDTHHDGSLYVYGIDKDSDLVGLTHIGEYDNPVFYNSAAEFIEALEAFHKPKMRAMTPVEIVKTVFESELKAVVRSGDIIGHGSFNMQDLDNFYILNVHTYRYKTFLQYYELLVSINDDGTLVTKKFEVEE